MRRALAAEGYDAVTIEGLATEADVSKQTIYRWWSSKAAILGEALLEGSLPGADAVPPFTADLAADLRSWCSAVSAQLSRPEGIALARALIAVTATDPSLGAVLNERLAAPIREWVASRLAVAAEDGVVRADVDAAAIADQLVAMASYAALLGRPLEAEQVNGVVRVLMRGISVAGTE